MILAPYVQRVEGADRPANPEHIAAQMAGIASADSPQGSKRVVLVAFGNPYLICHVPAAGTYLVTFSVGDASD